MRDLFSIHTWCCVVILIGACALASFGAPQGDAVGRRRAGGHYPACRRSLPMSGYDSRKQGFQKIHDPIYARAIVLSDGTRDAAILSWELIGMPDGVWQDLSQRIAKELGHSRRLCDSGGRARPQRSRGGRRLCQGSPATIAYTAKLEDEAFEAVKQAKAHLQPARFGFGTGKAYVNINRRERFPDGRMEPGLQPGRALRQNGFRPQVRNAFAQAHRSLYQLRRARRCDGSQ